MYDFLLFLGASIEIEDSYKKQYGLGGAVVLKLTQNIEPQQYFLYFDNYFSSYNLFYALDKKGIYAAGTDRLNRFEKPPLLSDKEMAKLGRGTSFKVTSTTSNTRVGLI